MTILIVILIILILLLTYQYAQLSEQRKSRFTHTWFSKSNLATNRMKWWKWIILSMLLFFGCFSIFIPSCRQYTENILLLLLLVLIYWFAMKPITRLSSFQKRTLGEAILILTLLCSAFIGYEMFNYSLTEKSGFFQQPDFWKNLLLFTIPNFIWLMLVIYMIRYYTSFVTNKRQKKALKLLRLKTQLNSAQLEALQTRINPHFLYNALNSIAGLALTDGVNTRRMALALSRFFSYCSDPKASPLITVRKEIEIATTYLEIEKIRFGEKIDFQTNITPEAQIVLIPRLLLQPLVENAVKHGMHSSIPVLHIMIHIYTSDSLLVISVQDNGQPFPEDFIPGYGLKSIYDRLDILFPEQYEIILFNNPQKEVRITLNKKGCGKQIDKSQKFPENLIDY